MITVTADDVRQLARSGAAEPVLAVPDTGDVRVVPAGEVPADRVLYTRLELVAEYGEEITDIEAEVLAGALTARLVGW